LMAQELRRLSVDFELTIIGPDWKDYTVADLAAEAQKKGLADHVKVVAPRRGEEPVRSSDAAHLLLPRSIIAGYRPPLAVGQAGGVPGLKHVLRGLVPAQDNEGIVAVRQGGAGRLAREVAGFPDASARCERGAQASVQAAVRMTAYGMSSLYQQV